MTGLLESSFTMSYIFIMVPLFTTKETAIFHCAVIYHRCAELCIGHMADLLVYHSYDFPILLLKLYSSHLPLDRNQNYIV